MDLALHRSSTTSWRQQGAVGQNVSVHSVCRDLKPENVLLTPEGDVKLSDFGLGHLPTSSLHNDVLQTTCGTPNYVAPEVLKREGY